MKPFFSNFKFEHDSQHEMLQLGFFTRNFCKYCFHFTYGNFKQSWVIFSFLHEISVLQNGSIQIS